MHADGIAYVTTERPPWQQYFTAQVFISKHLSFPNVATAAARHADKPVTNDESLEMSLPRQLPPDSAFPGISIALSDMPHLKHLTPKE